jgi:O-antigen biosynthesis protein
MATSDTLKDSSNHVENFLKNIAEDKWLTQIRNYVPSAWLGHAPFLRFLIREIKPKVFVELGTHNGFSYFVGCQTIEELNLPAKAFAVDHWLGDEHAGSFDDSVYEGVLSLNNQYRSFSTLLKMSFSDARSKFEDHSVDLLHIDGFHTYEAVKEDFETWLPKLSRHAVVILHDIHVRHADFGVYKYWAEIKKDHQTIEFVGSYGLGVVFLNSPTKSSLQFLKNLSDSGLSPQFQGVFGGLSDTVLQNYRTIESENFRNQRSALENQISILAENFEKIQSDLTNVLHSKSWALTKPFRKIRKYMRGLGI